MVSIVLHLYTVYVGFKTLRFISLECEGGLLTWLVIGWVSENTTAPSFRLSLTKLGVLNGAIHLMWYLFSKKSHAAKKFLMSSCSAWKVTKHHFHPNLLIKSSHRLRHTNEEINSISKCHEKDLEMANGKITSMRLSVSFLTLFACIEWKSQLLCCVWFPALQVMSGHMVVGQVWTLWLKKGVTQVNIFVSNAA